MKKYIFFIGLSFFTFPLLSFAENEINYAPTVTVRGVFSGAVFRNNVLSPKVDETLQYELVEVSDPAFPLSRYPYGVVQFREPRGFRASDFCAQPRKDDANKITTYFCSLRGVNLVGTYFSLIPTNTGAVLIRNIATGKCLSIDDSVRPLPTTAFPILENCMLTPTQSDELYKQLWFLAPAFSAAGMSPL